VLIQIVGLLGHGDAASPSCAAWSSRRSEDTIPLADAGVNFISPYSIRLIGNTA
jgi:hypothetical protein